MEGEDGKGLVEIQKFVVVEGKESECARRCELHKLKLTKTISGASCSFNLLCYFSLLCESSWPRILWPMTVANSKHRPARVGYKSCSGATGRGLHL